jgi:molybdopterin-guanine dinucleotide biosynthesis protein A
MPDTSQDVASKLPVHGFVLAGGKSSRMGEDKALLRFGGKPMVEIAVEKLRAICAEVGIAGNRDDLAAYAPVVQEMRSDVGPAAGVEAGLRAATQPWVMFVPVDVPLMPVDLLRRWAAEVVSLPGLSASNLYYERNQPAFCMVRRECAERFSAALESGERRLSQLLRRAGEGGHRVHDLSELYAEHDYPVEQASDRWFANVNTPEDLMRVERWLASAETLHHKDSR